MLYQLFSVMSMHSSAHMLILVLNCCEFTNIVFTYMR
jgi:hypothetical protein